MEVDSMSWFSFLLNKKPLTPPIKVKHLEGYPELDPSVIPWTQYMMDVHLKYALKWGDNVSEWPVEVFTKYSRELFKNNPYK